jgi:hypothetical protein
MSWIAAFKMVCVVIINYRALLTSESLKCIELNWNNLKSAFALAVKGFNIQISRFSQLLSTYIADFHMAHLASSIFTLSLILSFAHLTTPFCTSTFCSAVRMLAIDAEW